MAEHRNRLKYKEDSESVNLIQHQDFDSDSDQHENVSLQAWSSDDDDIPRFGDNLTRRSIRSESQRFQNESPDSPDLQDRFESSDYMSDPTPDSIKHGQELGYYSPHLQTIENTSACPFIYRIFSIIGAVVLFIVLIALVSKNSLKYYTP